MPSEAIPTGAAVTVDGLEVCAKILLLCHEVIELSAPAPSHAKTQPRLQGTVLGYFAEDDTFEIRVMSLIWFKLLVQTVSHPTAPERHVCPECLPQEEVTGEVKRVQRLS